MSELPEGAHDRYLANYHTSDAQVWCSNPKCDLHEDGANVRYVSEYGQGWYEPEECWICHEHWVDEKPEPEEEGEE